MKTTKQKKNLSNKQILPVTNNVAKQVKPIIVQKERHSDSRDDILKPRRQK